MQRHHARVIQSYGACLIVQRYMIKNEFVPPEDHAKLTSFVSTEQQRCVYRLKEVGLIGARI